MTLRSGTTAQPSAHFSIFEFVIWVACGVAWWSLVHMGFVFIPGRLWMDGDISLFVGAISGAGAYVNFWAASREYWARTPRIMMLRRLMLLTGLVGGFLIGYGSARGSSTGPAGIMPDYEFPPTHAWRLFNGLCGCITGVLANLGVWSSIWHLSERRALFVACLVGALLLLYVAVPLVLGRMLP